MTLNSEGLEVVALDLTKRIEREFYSDQPGGAVQTRAKVQVIIAEALSQASSVIAGLTAERDEAVDRAKVWEHYWSQEVKVKSEVVSWAKEAMDKADAAEARISSLEEEIKRLKEALRKIAEMEEWQIGVPIDTEAANEHQRIASSMASDARQALEAHNG